MKFKPLWVFFGAMAVAGAQIETRAQLGQIAVPGQSLTTLRATELRADKLGSAPVVSNLASGAAMRLISVEGGWALVETPPTAAGEGPPRSGWVRASAVNWQSGNSVASSLPSGREAKGNTALTLGMRSLPPRANRHALIIGVGRYADAATPPLPGVRFDRESATQIAQAMQVPASNIHYLQDEQATGNAIRQAINDLTDKVQEGDRVFIHYSGHGTRYYDAAAGGCVEALRAYDEGWSAMITNREMATMLKGITNKTDKLFVMYDACYSGGVAQAASVVRMRGYANTNDEGLLRPKFASSSEECARPVNVKTRNLVVETTEKGVLPVDIVHLSASRENEISFDDELKGGLATQFMRDCILRDAKDLDNSGAISMDEIRQCAQEKINKRLANDSMFKPPNLVLSGNESFVPAWFSQSSSTAVTVAPPASAAPPAALPRPPASTAPARPPSPSIAVVTPVPAAPPVVAPPNVAPPAQVVVPPPLTGEQALRQMFDQRDAKRRVKLTTSKDKLKIGKDLLDLAVQSDRAGFVYVALAGSDNKSVYMLFPNELDKNNRIEAGQQILLPRPSWQIKAAGPQGTNNLLVMVTDAPRDLTTLAASKTGPFLASLNDAQGRAQLGALMTNSKAVDSTACANPVTRRKNPLCSDAYGASMMSVEEVK
jgi:hypothetical protein